MKSTESLEILPMSSSESDHRIGLWVRMKCTNFWEKRKATDQNHFFLEGLWAGLKQADEKAHNVRGSS